MALSYDAHRAPTLCWQAVTAMSVAGKHEVLCLNELPSSLSSPLPVIWELPLSPLPIHLRTSACACLLLSAYLFFMFSFENRTGALFIYISIHLNRPQKSCARHQYIFTSELFHLQGHLPPSVTKCPTCGKAALWNKRPCLFWPTLSGVCHGEGPLMHTNPPPQWPQSLKSVNREADAPD